ncbi:MAG: hypothetical protein IPO88_09710 [Nannocystis sp.]|uniref:hypothetical protein n=1 Tax=Nannocystis sp. TaxID=1962667 RepID=UPI0024256257|nr:hypothetical protein [Nannocystis sp.]MBK9753764.1 hypothetical protein [Nannocystis sp.]
MLAVALTACGDDKGDTLSAGSSSTDPTAGSTTVEVTTTASTSSATNDSTTTGPTTVEPTTDPATTDPSTTSGDSTSGTTGEPVELTCENYCALYATGCADFSEYANDQDCLSQCKQWPPGIAGETAGDSLGCRLYHVGVANQVDAKVHCPHAGPTGAMVCVSPDAPICQDYCDTYLKNCTDKLNLYIDAADCLTQCGEWYPGTYADTTGDTVGCRLYHAGVAMADANTHCPHAGPGGAMVCVAP